MKIDEADELFDSYCLIYMFMSKIKEPMSLFQSVRMESNVKKIE